MARRRTNENSSGLVLLGMVAGAAIGWAVGLVSAPASGEENRRRLSAWTSHRAADAKEMAQEKLPAMPGGKA